MTRLREMGFISVIYLDDILLFGNTYRECYVNGYYTSKLLTSLGFLVNNTKSKLVPVQKIRYIGFLYDSVNMCVSLPEEKISNTIKLVTKVSNLNTCSIRDFARFVGKLVSLCPSFKYAWLYTKLFERQKFRALRLSGGNYNAKMQISPELASDFQWWLNNLPNAKNSIRFDVFQLEIFSDASKTGWGVSCQGKNTHGFWSEEEIEQHIIYLELLAAFFGIKCFANKLSNCNILCRIDNTTAIAYINKVGSVQHRKLNKLSRLIWQWCEESDLFLYASYIKSSENKEADRESRNLGMETEWSLDKEVFTKIVS